MKRLFSLLVPFVFLTTARLLADTETIVFIRHGEKDPTTEVGQISVKGLNRALALPDVLVGKFKEPQFIFAPGEGDKVQNYKTGIYYTYLRPLATIEPTAIRLGLPVNTQFGFHQVEQFKTELLKDQYRRSTIFVAWEHHELLNIVKKLLADLGTTAEVPEWPKDDFDSIFVVTVQTNDGKRTAEFKIDHEGITPADTFPTPVKP